MTRFYWLVELFDSSGQSLGTYHTGRIDLAFQSRSTKSAVQACRYSKEEAERVADELNVFMMVDHWKAVEHGFTETDLPCIGCERFANAAKQLESLQRQVDELLAIHAKQS